MEENSLGGEEMTKQEFKICEAVALGLTHYYMGQKGFTQMSGSYEFSIWRKK